MTIKEAATKCGNSPDTVRRWCKKKGLKHTKVGFQGIIDISEKDLKQFCNMQGMIRSEG